MIKMKHTQVELLVKGSENGSKDLEMALREASLQGIAVPADRDNETYVNFTVEEDPGEAVAGLGYSLAKNVPGANYHIVERKYTPTSVIEEAEEVETQMHNFYDKPIREAA